MPEAPSSAIPSPRAQLETIWEHEAGYGQLSLFATVEEPVSVEDRQLTFDDFFAPEPVPEEVVAAMLRMGSNRRDSLRRICASYQQNWSSQENVDLLRKVYGEGGRGVYVDERPYAAWWNGQGMAIAPGRSARYIRRADVLLWEEVERRIRDLLEAGVYAPQETLDEAIPHEVRQCAAALSYLKHDLDTDQYFQGALYEGLHPEVDDRIAAALGDPEQLAGIVSELRAFCDAYAEDRGLLRFHYHRPGRLLERIQGLQHERRLFRAASDFQLSPPSAFITEDEIDAELASGSRVQDGKLRIYSFVRQGHSNKELADMLKKEYGYGGHSHALLADDGNAEYRPKGLELKRDGCEKVTLTWTKAAQRIQALVKAGRYMEADELEKVPEYERSILAAEEQPAEEAKPQPVVEVEAEVSPEVAVDDEPPFLITTAEWERIGQEYKFEKDGQKSILYQNVLRTVLLDDEQGNELQRFRFEENGVQRWVMAYSEVEALCVMELVGMDPAGISGLDHEPLDGCGWFPASDLWMWSGLSTQGVIDEYEEIKQSYPEHIVALQVEGFSYIFGDDAGRAAHILGSRLLAIELPDAPELPMTGFQADRWSTCGKRLWASGENILIVGQDADDGSLHIMKELLRREYIPRGSQIQMDGDLYSVEEVDFPTQRVMLRALTTQDISGAPVFRMETVPYVRGLWEEQQSSLENIAQSVELDAAQDMIAEFCAEEYGGPVDLSDLRHVPLAYTTTEDDVHEIQVEADLLAYRITYLVDGVQTAQKSYDSMAALIDQELSELNFNDLIAAGAETIVEPPPTPENYHITDERLGEGGAKTKFAYNTEAIETLKRIELEGRAATPEEQETLSRYVGWGSLPDAFDPEKEKWAGAYSQLKALLSDAEYKAARSSVLNAHYTSPTVIKAIYQCIGGMGFRQGNILEPAMGVGNFFGLLPKDMAGSKLYGAELDPITGRIARLLYPQARIEVKGYEQTAWPDNFFDVAVGNVPFGAYSVSDPRYDKLKFHIHDYFFAKTIDQVRPGGVIAFVTSRYTMDKKGSTVRRCIAQRCELLGAVRLPNNAFLANAGTQVTADILFLQKRERPVDREETWVQTGRIADGYVINQYFLDHPEMVLGELKAEQKLYGSEDLTCVPYPGTDLSALLEQAVRNIHGEIVSFYRPEEPDDAGTHPSSIPAEPDVKNFSFALVEGKLYFRENSEMHLVETSRTGTERIRGMIGVRDAVRELIDAQMVDCDDTRLRILQQRLNGLYDNYTARYGLLNSRGNALAFSDDSSYPLLCALEVLDEEGKLDRKADMFTKRTIRQAAIITHADTAAEALAVSIGERARVDLGYMSTLLGRPGEVEPIIRDLEGVIFRDPTIGEDPLAGWQTADEYLSGNVRLKLTVAEEWAQKDPGRYAGNVEALKAAQPKDLEASEIGVRLGAAWIPVEDYRQFVFELLDTPNAYRKKINVVYAAVNCTWHVSGKNADTSNNVKANTVYGTSRINAYEIIEASLNLRDVKIFDTRIVEGSEQRVLNKKETVLAQQKQEAIRQAFRDWVWKDPERRERLVDYYNEHFNDTRPRVYDGEHIKFVGMNPEIRLRKHQKDAVARILYGGNSLLAHVVGAGKTWTMAAAAMEGKRLGLCQKSLFVVPSHLTEQWGAEFLQLYPAANILVATKKDFQTANRKKFCGRIATGDYDAIIIGHSQFEKIPMSLERQEVQLERQIADIELGISDAKAEEGARYTIKQMEYTRKNLEEKLKRLTSTKRKDDVITFEELGVDRLFIDEAHYYKNLFYFSKMRNVAGISQTEAQKSSDLYMKCLYLDEITASRPGGPGRGVIFATGTPISNSMVELYTMMRYLQNGMLEEKNWSFFDSWATQFGETVTSLELAPEGTGYRQKTRFARFYNLPELMNYWKEATDIQTADMLRLPVPKANYHTEVVQPTQLQRDLVQSLGERAEAVRRGGVEPREDNMLKITSDGRKLALDQRLMNPMFPDEPDSKVNRCVANVFRIWEGTTPQWSAQLIFSDLSTPKATVRHVIQLNSEGEVIPAPFSVYYDIRDKLLDMGVPEEEIAFIHDANTDARKAELFAKVRSGQVRVLLGSTAKMGAGTNAQTRLIALHHLDVPWRPSDIEQREGRILRQGNQNPEVEIFRYVTESTFDAYSWQLIESKQKFIGQVMTGKSPARSCEDVDTTALSYAEVKALAAGDPKIKERMDLEVEVSKLNLLRSNYQNEHYRLEDQILKHFPSQLRTTEALLRDCRADLETRDAHPFRTADEFNMEIGGVSYRSKEAAGKAILSCAKRITSEQPVQVGSYRGLALTIHINTFTQEYVMTLQGALGHPATVGADPLGNITRLNHVLDKLPEEVGGYEARLETLHKQMADAKAELEQPWPQEGVWMLKSERLATLNAELNIDLNMSGPNEENDGQPGREADGMEM